MNKIDIEKIKRWKSHADFYRSMINEFYQNSLECGDFDEDIFYDYFYNDIITLEELLGETKVDNSMIELVQIDEAENGDGLYTFDYTDEFLDIVKMELAVENPTDEEIGEYIKNVLIEAAEEEVGND